MAELTAPMPSLPLKNGMRVVFEAIDPTTGDPIAGVIVSIASLYVMDEKLEADTPTAAGPFMMTPGPESATV